jgi:hypothetical protein
VVWLGDLNYRLNCSSEEARRWATLHMPSTCQQHRMLWELTCCSEDIKFLSRSLAALWESVHLRFHLCGYVSACCGVIARCARACDSHSRSFVALWACAFQRNTLCSVQSVTHLFTSSYMFPLLSYTQAAAC